MPNFEAEETSFAAELMTMPAFSADRDDEERLKTYILQRVPPSLKSELEAYLLYRTETFAARRAGGAVQSISAEADNTALLRLFGWMEATNRPVVGDSITFMIRDDLGGIAQEQILDHCELPQRLGLHHVVLLRQPRAQRRAAGDGPEPVDAVDQRPSREGQQDATDVREARGRLA